MASRMQSLLYCVVIFLACLFAIFPIMASSVIHVGMSVSVCGVVVFLCIYGFVYCLGYCGFSIEDRSVLFKLVFL